MNDSEVVNHTVRSRPGLVTVAVIAVLFAAGCTSGAATDGAPSPSPGLPRIDEPATLPELSIADEPRWGNTELDITLNTLSFVGEDTAVIRGYTEDSDYPQLYVVDAQTGKQRWSAGMLTSLDVGEDVFFMSTEWALAGGAGEEVVLGRYYAENCVTEPCPADPSPEEGVVGLSLRDGSVEWMHPTLPSLSEDDPELDHQRDLTTQVVSAGNGGLGAPAAVVGPTMSINGSENAAPEEFRTLGLDPATGEELWSKEGVVGQRGAGELLLATVPPDRGQSQGGPVALDLADGTERWNVAAEHTATSLVGAGAHTLLIANVLGGGIGGHQVLDLADGSVLHDLGTRILNPLVDQHGTDLVVGTAAEDPYSLASVTPEDEEPLLSAQSFESTPQPTLVADGYVLITDRGDQTTTAVDRSGNVLGSDLPGTPVLLTDDVVVLSKGSGPDSTFGVYDRN